MEITRDKLMAQRESLVQEYMAIGGAIHNIDHWLGVLDQPDPDLEPDEPEGELSGSLPSEPSL